MYLSVIHKDRQYNKNNTKSLSNMLTLRDAVFPAGAQDAIPTGRVGLIAHHMHAAVGSPEPVAAARDAIFTWRGRRALGQSVSLGSEDQHSREKRRNICTGRGGHVKTCLAHTHKNMQMRMKFMHQLSAHRCSDDEDHGCYQTTHDKICGR